MTPEGRVKRRISAYLRHLKAYGVWYDMPVPGGWGKSTLDYYGCYRGRFFAIEAKRPGETPTDRQQAIIADLVQAGAAVFVIDDPDVGIPQLRAWVDAIDADSKRAIDGPHSD